ncbi:MAG: phosphocholine cytidylyltransferase family protein [Candidatus Omnitrophica bacterium]|nr:phosphocholine cytidylyltransferase family protein [Candidatus Omnitrophota bacterium]
MSTPKAIILAAGRGSRLYPLTLSRPKCLLEVGGKRIIDWQIESLRSVGVEEIVMVVGYQKELLMAEVGPSVRYRVYDDFARTNNLHTLWSVREELEGDCFCLFADLIFEPEVLRQTIACEGDFGLVVDTGRILEGTMRVKVDGDRVMELGDQIDPEESNGNFIGVALIRQAGAGRLIEEMSRLVHAHEKDYYTLAVHRLAQQGVRVSSVDIRGKFWVEIDTKEDLERARTSIEQVEL